MTLSVFCYSLFLEGWQGESVGPIHKSAILLELTAMAPGRTSKVKVHITPFGDMNNDEIVCHCGNRPFGVFEVKRIGKFIERNPGTDLDQHLHLVLSRFLETVLSESEPEVK